jgi:hypothetical protein
MKYFSSRICNFQMQKLSTAAVRRKTVVKRQNFVNLLLYTYNIKKQKQNSWNLNFQHLNFNM